MIPQALVSLLLLTNNTNINNKLETFNVTTCAVEYDSIGRDSRNSLNY